MWQGIVGKFFTPESFDTYVKNLKLEWSPKGVTIHHTASPDLKGRPNGFTQQHMYNFEDFYKNTKKWSRGPHLFIDQNGIWVFSSLRKKGVHAKSFNNTHWGIEMLGDYDYETPNAKVIFNTYCATSSLLKKVKRSPSSVNFHRDDPLTDKSCPGKLIKKEWFMSGLRAVYSGAHINNTQVKITYKGKLLPVNAYIKQGANITVALLSELEKSLLPSGRSIVPDHVVEVSTFLSFNKFNFKWIGSTKTIEIL
jgi:hypothetical protein